MTTFYNETSLNGKYQVLTTEELSEKGTIKISSNAITMQDGEIFKNLNNYWVTKDVFENIKSYPKSNRAPLF